MAGGFARRHNGAADASATLRPSAGYRGFAPLRRITSGWTRPARPTKPSLRSGFVGCRRRVIRGAV